MARPSCLQGAASVSTGLVVTRKAHVSVARQQQPRSRPHSINQPKPRRHRVTEQAGWWCSSWPTTLADLGAEARQPEHHQSYNTPTTTFQGTKSHHSRKKTKKHMYNTILKTRGRHLASQPVSPPLARRAVNGSETKYLSMHTHTHAPANKWVVGGGVVFIIIIVVISKPL